MNRVLLAFIAQDDDIKWMYHTEFVLVNCSSDDITTLEDGFQSYLDSIETPSGDLRTLIAEVLSRSGFSWAFLNGSPVPACDAAKAIML